MSRDPRYDILFEPVRIGPVTARNRFYQVPHCTGMGYDRPATLAAMRGIKAEGGWGVVNTEFTSIHPTSDDAPFPSCSLWDEDDVRTMAVTADAIHEHGALAGTQLWHGGLYSWVRMTREVPIAASGRPIAYPAPIHARTMDKSDIAELRRWQVDAARRAKRAGFDIVYVYGGHSYLPAQFISRRFNRRSDEYGGSLENRVRLFREMIIDTKEAIGDTCAVVVRFSMDELSGALGIESDQEGREVVEMLAELPDLWDVNVADYRTDSGSSRFFEEGFQERHQKWVKPLTSKPVVGVGRYTSPDAMVSLIRRGVLDLIGSARPSIADPFLPAKIEEGRLEDIRECIGCNICRGAAKASVPIRCTQNPTMGEEWRSGWHPERIQAKKSDDAVLVIGAGPAGLEATRALAQRGHAVTLAEAGTELGGHVARIARLPGLAAWKRVTDWRIGQIEKMRNVEVYRDSALSPDDVAAFGFPHVVVATGCTWVKDGTGRAHLLPIPGHERAGILTPDDLLGESPAAVSGPVVIYDDDHYYMAGALAERLVAEGHDVTLLTPAPEPCVWMLQTDEHHMMVPQLYRKGIRPVVNQRIEAIGDGTLELRHTGSGEITTMAFGTLVLATAREPDNGLIQTLGTQTDAMAGAGIRSVTAIGDCLAPGLIVDAVYAGHRFAREFQEPPAGDVRYRRDRVVLNGVPAS